MPITILPGIGMLILSTTGQMMTLSGEIGNILSDKCTEFEHKIAGLKIEQVKRLTYASTLLYIAAGMYVLSGIIGAFLNEFAWFSNLFLLVGTVAVFLALVILVIYSFKTIRIRQNQFDNNHSL